MPVGKGRNDIDDLFGDLLGDDLGDSTSPSPPVARKGKKVDVYDDAFYEQLAKDSGAQVIMCFRSYVFGLDVPVLICLNYTAWHRSIIANPKKCLLFRFFLA